jgi:hypothetical protein
MVGVNNYINMFICPTTSNTSKNKGQRKAQHDRSAAGQQGIPPLQVLLQSVVTQN